jgi:hypothetical protein
MGVILSEAAESGEVEESVILPPKAVRSESSVSRNGSFGALRLLRMTQNPTDFVCGGGMPPPYSNYCSRTINTNLSAIYYIIGVVLRQRKSRVAKKLFFVQTVLTFVFLAGKIYAVWCILPQYGFGAYFMITG